MTDPVEWLTELRGKDLADKIIVPAVDLILAQGGRA